MPLSNEALNLFLEDDRCNELHLENVDDASLEELRKTLLISEKKPWQLTSLSLQGEQIGDKGAQVIAKILDTENTFLNENGHTKRIRATELYININTINPDATQTIMTAIANSTSLLKLQIEHKELSSDTIGKLAVALEKNKSIATVDLSKTGISDNDAATLEMVVSTGKNIITLDLSKNPKIAPKTLEGINGMLKINADIDSMATARRAQQSGNHLPSDALDGTTALGATSISSTTPSLH